MHQLKIKFRNGNPLKKNTPLLLKLFFSRYQDIQDTIDHLTAYREKLVDRHNMYLGIQEMIKTQLPEQDDAPFWLITLDYGLRANLAASEWCDETKRTLSP